MPDEPPSTEARRQFGVADLQVDGIDLAAKRVRGDLRERRPGAGADVDGADLTA